LTVLARLTGGAGRPADGRRAARKLQRLISDNGTQVLRALVDAYNAHSDSLCLLETLGACQTASGDRIPEGLAGEVRAALLAGATAGDAAQRTSGASGMAATAAQWTNADVDRLTTTLTDQLVATLAGAAQIPAGPRRRLIDRLVQKLAGGERVLALRGLAALAAHMIDADITAIRACATQTPDMAAAAALIAVVGLSTAASPAAARALVQVTWPQAVSAEQAAILQRYADTTTDVDTAARLPMLAYGTPFKTPVAAIFHRWGVELSNESLIAWASAAVRTYGEATVRRVAGNVATYNAMPDPLKVAFGHGVQVDPRQVAAQLANGRLRTSNNRFLLRDFKAQTQAIWLASYTRWREATRSFETLQTDYQRRLGGLERLTRRGVKWHDHLEDLLTIGGHTDLEAFEIRQSSSVRLLRGMRAELGERAQTMRQAYAEQAVLESSFIRSLHSEALVDGDQRRADRIALARYTNLGAQDLQSLDAQMWRDLTVSDGGLARLQKNGDVDNATVVQYEGDPADRFTAALNRLSPPRVTTAPAAAPGATEDALRTIDRDPALSGLLSVADQLAQGLPTLKSMLESGRQGTQLEDFVEDARDLAGALHEHMTSAQCVANIATAKLRRTALQNATFRASGEAKRQLGDRLLALNRLIATFESGNVQSLLNSIREESQFNEDTIGSWFAHDGWKAALTLVVAVAVFVLAIPTGGMSLVVGVKAAALAAGAAIVTYDLASEAQYQVNQRCNDSVRDGRTTYNQRPLFMRWAAGGQVRDPVTGTRREAEFFRDVAPAYATRFVQDFALNLAAMGCGALAARFLAPRLGAAAAGLLSRFGPRMRMFIQGVQRLPAGGAGGQAVKDSFGRALAKEVLDEVGDEVREEAAEQLLSRILGKADRRLSILATLLVATASGSRIRAGRLAAHGYDATDPGACAQLTELFRNEGHQVEQVRPGVLAVTTFDGYCFVLAPEGDAILGEAETQATAPPTAADINAAQGKALVLKCMLTNVLRSDPEGAQTFGLSHLADVVDDVTVRFEERPGEIPADSAAVYSPRSNTVIFNLSCRDVPSEILINTLCHEVQHAYDQAQMPGGQVLPANLPSEIRAHIAQVKMGALVTRHYARRGKDIAAVQRMRGYDPADLGIPAGSPAGRYLSTLNRVAESYRRGGREGLTTTVRRLYGGDPDFNMDLAGVVRGATGDLVNIDRLRADAELSEARQRTLRGMLRRYDWLATRYPNMATDAAQRAQGLADLEAHLNGLIDAVRLEVRGDLTAPEGTVGGGAPTTDGPARHSTSGPTHGLIPLPAIRPDSSGAPVSLESLRLAPLEVVTWADGLRIVVDARYAQVMALGLTNVPMVLRSPMDPLPAALAARCEPLRHRVGVMANGSRAESSYLGDTLFEPGQLPTTFEQLVEFAEINANNPGSMIPTGPTRGAELALDCEGFDGLDTARGRFFAEQMRGGVDTAVAGMRSGDLGTAAGVLAQLAASRRQTAELMGDPRAGEFGVRRRDDEPDGFTTTGTGGRYVGYQPRLAQRVQEAEGQDYGEFTMQGQIGNQTLDLTTGSYLNGRSPADTWVHTPGRNIAPIMAHVETLYQRAMNPNLPLEQTIETVAEIHWWLAHAMPYKRGSAAITDAFTKAIFECRGMDTGRWSRGVLPDLEAFVMPLDQFKARYSALLTRAPGLTTTGDRASRSAPGGAPAQAYRSLTPQDVVSLLRGEGLSPRGEGTGRAAMEGTVLGRDHGYICATEVAPSGLRKGDPGTYVVFRTAGCSYISKAQLLREISDVRATRWADQQEHGLIAGDLPQAAVVELVVAGRRIDPTKWSEMQLIERDGAEVVFMDTASFDLVRVDAAAITEQLQGVDPGETVWVNPTDAQVLNLP